MKKSDRVKRYVAFYTSVALFMMLLPIVLSYSLGYHIEYFPKFIIYKTGNVYIRSDPAGASIYVNGALSPQTTPARLEELKPGNYKIEVRREGFYPWQKDLTVHPNMVTKVDNIVLFPIIQEVKRISPWRIVDYAVSDKNLIYYLTNDGLFRSGLDGSGMRKILTYSNWPADIKAKKFFPDETRLLFFNTHNIWIAHLTPAYPVAKGDGDGKVEHVFESGEPIVDVFWYSVPNYLIVVTHTEIIGVELSGESRRNNATIYTFNVSPKEVFYNSADDSLYFSDKVKDDAGKEGMCLYFLELKQKNFDRFMLRLRRELEIINEQDKR